MSTRQTAVINGLLAENIGKNDLVRSADSRANQAEARASDAEHNARFNQLKVDRLEAEAKKLKEENAMYRELLSKPMREIAEISGDFRKTYLEQQQMIAEWILAQRAYKETATAIGIEIGKSPEEIKNIATQNANAILENKSKHGNNAADTPLLSDHAANILALRKKNGKA
ncbi:hypothetical protein HFK89_02960 [Ralstonia pseudosolanacearum]|uniref:hypothetical protein n=1 Tax=Ralstonia pseudosolanacearum TaxID=1310165 RepID=UPI001113CE50|nr:hypothetical protein [Ralstonia pseudosolanacearum]MCK4161427.1 hypothetical protein [Ralstonia pseudosolanacearum]